MGRARRWTGEPGYASIEPEWDELEEEEPKDPENTLQIRLLNFVIEHTKNPNINIEEEFDYICFDIDFTSSGYYDPGKFWGDPDSCYPPEGDDEREMSSVKLTTESLKEVELDEELAQLIFDKYYDKISEVDIE